MQMQILWLENLSNEVMMAAIQLVIGWKLAIAVWVLLLQLFHWQQDESHGDVVFLENGGGEGI